MPWTSKKLPKLVGDPKAAEMLIRDRVDKGNALKQSMTHRFEWNKWHDYNIDMLMRLFDDRIIADGYGYKGSNNAVLVILGLIFLRRDGYYREFVEALFDRHIRRLEEISERLYIMSDLNQYDDVKNRKDNPVSARGRSVFVVHGHDEAAREAVARFLERLGLHPVVLHEKANQGLTLIEKFEFHADVAFAVVLLTPDDECLVGPTATVKRARQNVVLELGFFLGALGRERVATLYREGVDLPTDMAGLVYVPLDKASNWKLLLARELKAAGLDFNVDRVL